MDEFLLIALEQAGQQAAHRPWSSVDQNETFAVNRIIVRILLGIISGWAILASVVTWVFIPGGREPFRSIALIGLLASGLYALLLVIQNKPGNIIQIVFLTPFLLIVTILLFVSMLNADFQDVSEYVFIVYFLGVVTPVFMGLFAYPAIELDPLPVTSRFLRWLYPRRYRHLNEIREFAGSRGWNITGLQGPTHVLLATGVWNGKAAKITSERVRYKVQRTSVRDRVVIVVTFKENLYTVIADRKSSMIYPSKVQSNLDKYPTDYDRGIAASRSVIEAGRPYFGETGELFAHENEIAYVTGEKGILENRERLQAILSWLSQIGDTMIGAGLVEEPDGQESSGVPHE